MVMVMVMVMVMTVTVFVPAMIAMLHGASYCN
jgi:hypothetical protein